MKYKNWFKDNFDILIGGIFPITCFTIIWTLSFLNILNGWIGLGVFAFTIWICLVLSLAGLVVSFWKKKKVILLRNVWFLPTIIIFISTIGTNIFENLI